MSNVVPALIGGLCLFSASVVAENNELQRLLENMDQAIENLNYEGTFVHIVEGKVETMYLVHQVENGKVSERLSSLDGPGREIIRNDEETTCIFADQKAVIVERREDGGPLRSAIPVYSDQIEQHYEFVMLRPVKKMNRDAVVFAIRPKDRYRFGYKLWMDKATGMPLKSQMVDLDGKVKEQLLFVSISLPDHIPEAKLKPTIPADDFTWHVQDQKRRAEERERSSNWRASNMPVGFRMTKSKVTVLAGSEAPVDHIVYSDGVASVSVFVEPSGTDDNELDGDSTIGGANAYSTRVKGYDITAVGEVPSDTVRMIARSVRAQSPAVAAQ
ncbi:MAG: MucB/RseB C-terminal domain-containing protein [Gammaproteobacteria bacterium]